MKKLLYKDKEITDIDMLNVFDNLKVQDNVPLCGAKNINGCVRCPIPHFREAQKTCVETYREIRKVDTSSMNELENIVAINSKQERIHTFRNWLRYNKDKLNI